MIGNIAKSAARILAVGVSLACAAAPSFAMGCFERSFTAEQLAERSRQVISGIAIDNAGSMLAASNGQTNFEIRVNARDRQTGAWHTAPATCTLRSGQISCSLENDGGAFTLWRGAEGGVVLRGAGELRIGDFAFGGKNPGDKTYILQPAVCRASA